MPPSTIPTAPWPDFAEAASETGVRDRLLICLLAAESSLSRRPADPAMADAATVEHCAQQLRDWIGEVLRDGRVLSDLLLESILMDEMAMLRDTLGFEAFDARPFGRARESFLNGFSKR